MKEKVSLALKIIGVALVAVKLVEDYRDGKIDLNKENLEGLADIILNTKK